MPSQAVIGHTGKEITDNPRAHFCPWGLRNAQPDLGTRTLLSHLSGEVVDEASKAMKKNSRSSERRGKLDNFMDADMSASQGSGRMRAWKTRSN